MKLKTSWFVACGTAACLFIASRAQAQVTGQVYAVSLSGSVVVSENSSSNQQTIVKGKFASADIINLAQGFALGTAVPANEKLALVFVFQPNGNPDVELVVYDSTGQQILTQVSQVTTVAGAISSAGKGTGALSSGINSVGSFTGGWLAMTGKITVTGNNSDTPSITAFSGAVQGVFEAGGDEIIITKGTGKLLGSLGTVIVPSV